MIIWVSKFKTSLARRACVRGIRDDHLGLWDCGTLIIRRKMEGRKIIQVGQEILDEINRMDRMNWDKSEMIIWVCGTVGLWDSCRRLNDPSLARQACVPKIEMIIWVCGTVGL